MLWHYWDTIHCIRHLRNKLIFFSILHVDHLLGWHRWEARPRHPYGKPLPMGWPTGHLCFNYLWEPLPLRCSHCLCRLFWMTAPAIKLPISEPVLHRKPLDRQAKWALIRCKYPFDGVANQPATNEILFDFLCLHTHTGKPWVTIYLICEPNKKGWKIWHAWPCVNTLKVWMNFSCSVCLLSSFAFSILIWKVISSLTIFLNFQS